ncbi:MAG: hypothetical protein KDA21_12145, partial [Phycisphaerales bacterium]|nr:hypothetical protein [Phycisphaerales bacterium]
DGLLGDAEREAFEALLAQRPELAREVESQRRIDESLRRQFAPPERIDVRAAATSPASNPVRRGPGWLVISSIAALLLVAAGVWFTVIRPNQPAAPPRPTVDRQMAVDTVYRLMSKRDFEPEWKCETDAEFIAAVQDRLGAPLLLEEDLPALAVVGWAYADRSSYTIISPLTMILICRLENGDPVLVFIDRLDSDVAPERRSTTDLHLFRREFGELVLYELSPQDQSRVLDRFTVPVPKAPGP